MILQKIACCNFLTSLIKRCFFLLFFIFSVHIHGQVDIKKSFTIPDSSSRILPSLSSKTPSLLAKESNTPASFDLKPDQKNFMIQETFANRGRQIEKKLNKWGKEEQPAFKTDQYLGDFKSNAAFVRFFCRDHEYVDGDRVRVYLNDSIIQHNILLDYRFKDFQIVLVKGFNKIDIEALNQGTSGPNTAEFRVYDDTGKMVASNAWNLATGVKATFIIVKE